MSVDNTEKKKTFKPHRSKRRFPSTHHNVKTQGTKIFALGGLNEVGKNTYCIECNDEMIIIDAGVKFASEGLPGIDYVIPDYTYLRKNNKKIKGLFITHGHEDHIGGIPFLLRLVNIPFIYASPLACAMIRRKLEEHHLTHVTKMIPINHESSIKTKYFNIGFFNTNHSIPESMGIIVNTPDGRIVETGDFKFDLSPVANPADYQIMSFLGETGVDLLMSDSTNAEVPTFSISEKTVAGQVQEEFRKTEGRIIVATFASNIHRVQQIVEAAVKFNRKILVYGRSMVNNIDVARKMGYIKCPDRFFIKNDEAKHLPDNEILILCTGSQGEALAALNRIANGTHRQIKIKPGDTVLFSSNPIPGNQSSVSRLINKLYRSGARVLENSMISNLHTSGHASQEEQKLMLTLAHPQYFLPVHGEFKQLKRHAETAEHLGYIPKQNIYIAENGQNIRLSADGMTVENTVTAGAVMVDGYGVGDVGNVVLRDRHHLSEDGIIIVTAAVDGSTGQVLSGPDLVSRGFVYVRESEELMDGARMQVEMALDRSLSDNMHDWASVKARVREALSSYIYRKTKRSPMILPILLEV